VSAPGIPVESDWRAIAHDLEGQLGYVMRRCTAAEGDADDPVPLAALVGDAQDLGRLRRG
jgi:hypothetical protein